MTDLTKATNFKHTRTCKPKEHISLNFLFNFAMVNLQLAANVGRFDKQDKHHKLSSKHAHSYDIRDLINGIKFAPLVAAHLTIL